MSGPTELTTTIVFSFTLATASTRLSPFDQAVKFLRSPILNDNELFSRRLTIAGNISETHVTVNHYVLFPRVRLDEYESGVGSKGDVRRAADVEVVEMPVNHGAVPYRTSLNSFDWRNQVCKVRGS